MDQCCGSVTFWYRYGSGDPLLWLMDPDLDPAILSLTFMTPIKLISFKKFFCLLLFEGTYSSFAGSVLLNNGSGSRRPKTYGSDGPGSGSATLLWTIIYIGAITVLVIKSLQFSQTF
jgi:hypothetical protein